MLRTIALAAGGVLVAAAATVFAQPYPTYGTHPYDPYAQRAGDRQECWNQHAGHFEGVRPGERQDDLDFYNCRSIAARWAPAPGYAYNAPPAYAYNAPPPDYRGYREECWNPHARHYERVRPGEVQNDLDFRYCRTY